MREGKTINEREQKEKTERKRCGQERDKIEGKETK